MIAIFNLEIFPLLLFQRAYDIFAHIDAHCRGTGRACGGGSGRSVSCDVRRKDRPPRRVEAADAPVTDQELGFEGSAWNKLGEKRREIGQRRPPMGSGEVELEPAGDNGTDRKRWKRGEGKVPE